MVGAGAIWHLTQLGEVSHCGPRDWHVLLNGVGLCDRLAALRLTEGLSAVALGVTLFVPAAYASALFAVSRYSPHLAYVVPCVVRPAIVLAAVAVMLQGTALACTMYGLSLAFPSLELEPSLLVAVIIAGGFGWVGLVMLFQALRPWPLKPVGVAGVTVSQIQVPELWGQISHVADRLGATPPTRLILGLGPAPFVTSVPVKPRGEDPLPAGETVYLPVYSLRVLSQSQLNALIGHELGHFRAADATFTARFAPSYRALFAAVEDLAPEPTSGSWAWVAKMPAQQLIAGIGVLLTLTVNRVRRARELQADRAAVEVSSATDCGLSLAKCVTMIRFYHNFRSAIVGLLNSGKGFSNLSELYTNLLVAFISQSDRPKLRNSLLRSRLAHPVDTHPRLAERITALGLDPDQVVDQALEELIKPRPTVEELRLFEELVSQQENEWLRAPGSAVQILPITNVTLKVPTPQESGTN